MNSYRKGALVRVTGTFKTNAGALLDPTAVRFAYQIDEGATTTLLYGTDTAVVRDSVGVYHFDIDAAASGSYFYRWYSTGTGQAAAEDHFYVESHF